MSVEKAIDNTIKSLVTAEQIRKLDTDNLLYTKMVDRIKKAAFNGQQLISVYNMTPAIKNRLELDGFIVTAGMESKHEKYWWISWNI